MNYIEILKNYENIKILKNMYKILRKIFIRVTMKKIHIYCNYLKTI